MKYKCTADLQTGNWCVGIVKTAEGWRRRALYWANSDQNEWAIEALRALHKKADNEIIDFISDYWGIKLVKEK